MKSTAYDSSLNNDLLNLAKSSKNLPKNTNSGAVTITEENEILKLPKRQNEHKSVVFKEEPTKAFKNTEVDVDDEDDLDSFQHLDLSVIDDVNQIGMLLQQE